MVEYLEGEYTMRLKTGNRYVSRVWLNPTDNSPLEMKVTRIAMGVVYYRPHYGLHDDGTEWLGAPASFPLEQAGKWIMEANNGK
jgi:hypothetical protein